MSATVGGGAGNGTSNIIYEQGNSYCGDAYVSFDVNQTVLSGVPAAQLQNWLTAAQNAYALFMIGGNPINLQYAQGDGNKSITRNITTPGQLQSWIFLLQRALGYTGPLRRPMRVGFR